MLPRVLAIAITFAASSVVFGQADAAAVPRTMFGFLKPGMCLGIVSVEGTTNVTLHTYTEVDYKVAQELKDQLGTSLKSASSIAQTNAFVRDKLEEYVSRHNLSDDSRKHIMIMPPVRTSFGIVVAVGDDYLLLNLDREHDGKRIIPKASIGSIYLDANPVRFIDPGARSRSGRSE